jgi:hypothetical protein
MSSMSPLMSSMPSPISSLCEITFLNTDPCICPNDFEKKPYSIPDGPTNEMKCVKKLLPVTTQ